MEVNKDFITIKVVGKIEASGEISDGKMKQMFENIDMNGSFTSNIKVNSKTGWVIEAKTIQNITGDITMKKTDNMPNGMKMNMIMTNEMLVTDK